MSVPTERKQRAAWLVALDEMSQPEIAQAVGISERQLRNWKNEPEFQEAVRAHCAVLMRELIAPAIQRLRRTIRDAKPADANKACEIALKAAGWIEAAKSGEAGGNGGQPPGAPAPAFDDLRGLAAGELDRRISDALGRTRGGGA